MDGIFGTQVTCAKGLKLIVMNPLELGDKLTELEIKEDWTIGPRRIGFRGGILGVFFFWGGGAFFQQLFHFQRFKQNTVFINGAGRWCVFSIMMFLCRISIFGNFGGNDSQVD